MLAVPFLLGNGGQPSSASSGPSSLMQSYQGSINAITGAPAPLGNFPTGQGAGTPGRLLPAQGTSQTRVAAPTPNYSAQALAALDTQMNQLNAREGGYYGDINNQYSDRLNSISANKTTGEENLNRQRVTEARQKDMSIRDLANNIRNSYQAGVQKLGVQGAGDSSATGMYKYALGQLEGQNRGQLVDNYQFNVGNIDLATTQLERDYKNKIAELDGWKRSQVFAIADKFQVARDQLNAQRTSLGAGVVSQQQAQLAQQAAAQLANVSATVMSANQAVQDNFAKAAAELRAYNLNNVTPNTQFNATNGTQNQALQVANPTLYKKYNE
ncbi:MAG TPA: hypothetical protein PKC05_02650 [Candidatus Saccharibacteria bacterium]|nr:hypothetical protein [Candidatus Saccharibacteria bacterium]